MFLLNLPIERDSVRRRACRWLRTLVAAACIAGPSAGGAVERSLNEFWPEIDAFVQLDPNWRVFVIGTLSRAMETGLSTEGMFGVHLDYLGAPLPRRLLAAVPSMDRYWGLSFRTGYNRVVVWNPQGPNEDRVVLEATLRSEPLWRQVQLANRSRVDLRRIGDDDSWRYRNRSRIERTWPVGHEGRVGWIPGWRSVTAATPYGMAEFFWDSRYAAWSRRFFQVGVEFELDRERSVDVYFATQDDRRAAGAELRALGIAFTFRY
jgi:hypothetical protein